MGNDEEVVVVVDIARGVDHEVRTVGVVAYALAALGQHKVSVGVENLHAVVQTCTAEVVQTIGADGEHVSVALRRGEGEVLVEGVGVAGAQGAHCLFVGVCPLRRSSERKEHCGERE